MNIYEKIIAVTNRKICSVNFLEQIERVCRLQPRALILREKDLEESEYEKLAREVMNICDSHNVRFIAHSFVKAASNLGCKNIHLPLMQLMQLSTLKSEFLKEFRVIGASCHSEYDVINAQKLGATYVFLGNIYETDCKKGLPGKGLELLQKICAFSSIPVYAIGGVTIQRMNEILNTGAAGGCMMSGFMKYREDT